MKRQNIELFNISFLDLLSGALGAVIFLFIVVPKGEGEAPAVQPQLSVMYDTVQQQFFGEIPDSLLDKIVGDSLLAVVVDYKKMPSIENCPPPKKCPECPEIPKQNDLVTNSKTSERTVEKAVKKIPAPEIPTPELSKNTAEPEKPTPRTSRYDGPLPSVPCSFSIELKWEDEKDNVDLYVCKDGDCVFGARRYRDFIGFWDSGKSRTSIFGGDLRTSQEAVRQFDGIIPGEYTILAQYKESPEPKDRLSINGLVYTNSAESGEQGEKFTISLPLSERERTRVGVMNVNADGSFHFQLSVNP
ncbi:hypothetical protein [Membranihabitans maritimus]|uniref:hypothetical protein n=1 Tax=Membranihabitans maritimus TaxID=2904244 RepID=UPI001F1FC557|nr:hypothetical protein [Membranihabitans maritimus]